MLAERSDRLQDQASLSRLLRMDLPMLDTRGDFCPLPLLKLKRFVAGRTPGEGFEIWSTDPLAPLDFEVWCLHAGHRWVPLPDDPAGFQRGRIVLAEPAAQ